MIGAGTGVARDMFRTAAPVPITNKPKTGGAQHDRNDR